VVMTLGLWRFTNPEDAQVGSKILQASTLLHELAHNLWGYHGGEKLEYDLLGNITKGLNCKPNQQSVLNYLYHATGVLDRFGKATVDLSGESVLAPDQAERELALNEQVGLGSGETKYRLRWYAPAANAERLLGLPAGTITLAKGHCDGSPLSQGEISTVVRVD